MVKMVLLEVRMVPLEVTWTVEELLERNTLEDFLENLLLEEVEEVLCGRRRGPCRGQKPLVGGKFERALLMMDVI